MEFRLLSDDESAASESAGAEYWAAEDARRERAKKCGAHEWELELEHPDDGAGVYLYCTRCPAGIDDLYPDGYDLMCGCLSDDETLVVEAGRHNSPMPLIVPVEVEVWSHRYSSPGTGEEWDGRVELHPRGPARAVPDPPEVVT